MWMRGRLLDKQPKLYVKVNSMCKISTITVHLCNTCHAVILSKINRPEQKLDERIVDTIMTNMLRLVDRSQHYYQNTANTISIK